VKSPFRITLYDKTFKRVGLLGDPLSVDLTLVHNGQSTGSFSIRADHQIAPKLLTEGCRVTVDYRGVQVLSGLVDSLEGSSDVDSELVVSIADDWAFWASTLGWQDPTSQIGTQTASLYDTKTGPAETVVKYFASRAITRLGLPITVAPDLARGSSITVQMRMDLQADKLFPLVDQAGVGTQIRQVGSGLRLDCYTPAWYPHTLTPRSGMVAKWEWSKGAPKATRVVVGGAGDGLSRFFVQRIDTAAEALWGIKREAFVDSTDSTTPTLANAKGDAALAENAATSGLKLTLAETDTFRYGDHLRVGDTVTTQLIPGAPTVTDVLREATIKWDASDGLNVTPTVGDRDGTNRGQYAVISKLARAVRIKNAGR